jgi:rod shape-determining protein MreC
MRRLTHRQRLAATVLAVVALCFITVDLGGTGLSSAHGGVRGTLGALYRGTDTVLGPVRRFVQGLPEAGSNRGRIDELQHENAQLRGRLAAADADRATAARLDKLELAAGSGGYRIVAARVIALGPGQGFDWTLTLDAGSASGVRAGQSVTDGDGLVGRVLHADGSTCVVLLAADPGSGVGVRDLRNGQLGLATGAGASGFTVAPLDPAARIEVGDRFVTGPVGATSYLAGLSVGQVTSVRTSADGSPRATVRPTASPTSLDLVGVVVDGGGANAARAPLPTTPPNTGNR